MFLTSGQTPLLLLILLINNVLHLNVYISHMILTKLCFVASPTPDSYFLSLGHLAVSIHYIENGLWFPYLELHLSGFEICSSFQMCIKDTPNVVFKKINMKYILVTLKGVR